MSRFWSWFIPFILIICIIVYMLIIKINNTKLLTFDNVLLEPKLITTVSDRKLYSIYDTNDYKNKSLSDILDSNIISLNNIVNKMDFKDEANDGGTKIYYSEEVANVPIYLIECNNLSGNNNIYILNEMNIDYCRS